MAIECLTQVLERSRLPEHDRGELLDFLWRFVEESDLAQWEDDLQLNTTFIVLNRLIDCGEEIPDDSSLHGLPAFAVQMIYEIEELACANMYAGTRDYSPYTLQSLVRVLDLTLENGFSIPPIGPFLCSPFLERHGWGDPTPRSAFKER